MARKAVDKFIRLRLPGRARSLLGSIRGRSATEAIEALGSVDTKVAAAARGKLRKAVNSSTLAGATVLVDRLAVGRFLRVTPRKARTVVGAIRGRTAAEALQILRGLQKDAAADVRRILESAIANAKAADSTVNVDKLVVASATVQEGPKSLRRWRPRAHGRATRIVHRMSHVEIALAEE